MDSWHLEENEVIAKLETDKDSGLGHSEAQRRLERYGPNELESKEGRSAVRILVDQFTGALIVVLLVAAVVSAFLGEMLDSGAIMTIVILNAVLGFVQDFRAERAMAALKRLSVPTAKVIRAQGVSQIPGFDLVPGDIVLLEAGNSVPADGRLLEAFSFRTQEAALTGESQPVDKSEGRIEASALPIGDRHNMVHMGTVVSSGRAKFVVTATAMNTEIGRIAGMIKAVVPEPTPLQKRLSRLGRMLAVAALAIVAAVFLLGLYRGEPARLMFMTALSMAVAAVPEGLPAVATVALAIGAKRMLKRNALIRRLPAVETLGSVTVVCSDKTGTLTENVMTVEILDVAGSRLKGDRLAESTTGAPQDSSRGFKLLLTGAALCNDAVVDGGNSSDVQFLGDPTETALLTKAQSVGVSKRELDAILPRVREVPFDSDRKLMSTVHRLSASNGAAAKDLLQGLLTRLPDEQYLVFSKGAVDRLLRLSSRVWVGGQVESLDEKWVQRICSAQDEMAGDGMRVLGVAFRETGDLGPEVEKDLTFIGMLGLIDPPRSEAAESVRRCKSAGILPVMITGDHPLTARSIAERLGIGDETGLVTGQEMEQLSRAELEQACQQTGVYARVSPEHKLRIVEALQSNGHIVAMTGDGVNDAPALKKADIGVSMGITGSDVSKEASDMVLRDDNFATIVNAVEEGRIIYDNVRKFLKYTMTSNTGELWVMLLAPLVGMPLPLLPLQILWVNLVTDGLPGLALAFENPEKNVMRRPPYPPNEGFFARGMTSSVLSTGLFMGLLALGTGFWFWDSGVTEEYWRTIVFTVITLSQLGHALAIRSERDSLIRIGVFSNRFLAGSIAVTFVLQLCITYVPWLQGIFKTTGLSLPHLLLCLGVSTLVFWVVEARKWLDRTVSAA